MSAESLADYFKDLKSSDENNKRCADCGSGNPQWASTNHGSFICLMCSGMHRALGSNTSTVKSLTMDNWSEKQRKIMKVGGNTNLKEFFQEYDLSKATVNTKYNTIAADYYRNYLIALVEDDSIPERPSKEQGQKLLNRPNGLEKAASNNFSANNESQTFEPNTFSFDMTQKALNNWKSAAMDAFETISNKATTISKNTVETIQSEGVINQFTHSVSSTTNWIQEKGKGVLETVKSEGFWQAAQNKAAVATSAAVDAVSKAQKFVGEFAGNVKMSNLPESKSNPSSAKSSPPYQRDLPDPIV